MSLFFNISTLYYISISYWWGFFVFLILHLVKIIQLMIYSSQIQTVLKYFIKRKEPKGLSHVQPMEVLSTRSTRMLCFNPGMHTLQGTNSYLIGKGSSKILIDTGESCYSSQFINHLFDVVFIQTKTLRLDKILLTHGHPDHIGGVNAILKECSRRKLFPLPTVHKMMDNTSKILAFDCENISNGDIYCVDDDCTIEAVYTPGHTDDHVSFIIREDDAFVSGDCILGCGTTVFDDLASYMESLQMIKTLLIERNISKIYPGHGPVIPNNAIAKVEEYIKHRQLREIEVLHVMRSRLDKSNPWISSWELVNTVYGDKPFAIKISALSNLHHHLCKLKKENIVINKFSQL